MPANVVEKTGTEGANGEDMKAFARVGLRIHAGWIALVGLTVACSSGSAGSVTSSTSSDLTNDGGATLPACTWPASLDEGNASSGQCTAARALLACTNGSGTHEGCLSDDPTRCPSDGAVVVPGVFTCVDQCAPTEYGVSCGGIGPNAPPAGTPPAGCHGMEPTPAGVVFFCCPCGAADGG